MSETQQQVKTALESLPELERLQIIQLADTFVARISALRKNVRLSRDGALELLYKLGLYEAIENTGNKKERGELHAARKAMK